MIALMPLHMVLITYQNIQITKSQQAVGEKEEGYNYGITRQHQRIIQT